MPRCLPRSSLGLASRLSPSSSGCCSRLSSTGYSSLTSARNYTAHSPCCCGCRNNIVCSCACCVHPGTSLTPQKRSFVTAPRLTTFRQSSSPYPRSIIPSGATAAFLDTSPLLSSSSKNWTFTTHARRTFSSTPPNMAKEFKLKDIKSLSDVKDFEKVESEVEGVEGGKILVVKVDGVAHALSPKCTHYGAPLKNGVLTPDGRLTCPWHGGEFCSS